MPLSRPPAVRAVDRRPHRAQTHQWHAGRLGRQLYRLSLEGGEAEALTSGTEGVTAFAWAPDGVRIADTMTEPLTAAMQQRTGLAESGKPVEVYSRSRLKRVP